METKKLAVFINLDGEFFPAGILSFTEEGKTLQASEFYYGLRYLDRLNAIEIDPESLSINNKEFIRGRPLYPSQGLIIFGGIRDAAPDGWGRRVIEARLKAPLNSLPESVYLLEAGSDRTGALDIRKTTTSEAKNHSRNSVRRLQYLMEAADRIEQGLPIPSQLEDIFDAGSSMGGMRPKASVEDDNGAQWLAKFSSPNDKLNVPLIEYATMCLAAEAGLNVPAVKVVEIGNKSVMLIKRFDRSIRNTIQIRHHMVSALTMLGCHESESMTKSYWDISDSIRGKAPVAAIEQDQKELFSRMVFNIFVTNDDDHLRNHAFLWSSEQKAWRLSPLYDVMPHAMIGTERNLHLGVGEKGRFANLDNALSGYSRFGLTLREADEAIEKVWLVTRQWKTYFDEWGVPGSEIEKVSPAFRHIDELRSTAGKYSQAKIAPKNKPKMGK